MCRIYAACGVSQTPNLTEYTKGGETTTFTYDKAGNLTADDRARYTYDLFNRTEKVETFDDRVQVNHYDAEGLRSGIEEDGRLVQFIFRGQEVVTELEEDKGMIRYIRSYELIASDADSARTYYHYASDELGSITHVTAGEDILNRYEYDAWGNLTLCEETVENRFRFNGQQYDPISQQYYLRARYYNPVIGRFTQEDTYRGDGLNLYAYCRNNPVYYADPSGHQPNCVKDAAQKYMEQGMSAEEACRRAYAEHAEIKLADAENLTPQERYRLEERQRRLQGEDDFLQIDTSSNRPNNPEAIAPSDSKSQGVENDREIVNIDTGTANAFISQDSPIRHELKDYVQGKDMVMTETAANEFRRIVEGAGGEMEQSRAERFLDRVTIIPDDPSARTLELQVTRKVGANDIIIFGTGDNLNCVTMTSDAKFVRGASAQGVDFDVYIHQPVPLQGK